MKYSILFLYCLFLTAACQNDRFVGDQNIDQPTQNQGETQDSDTSSDSDTNDSDEEEDEDEGGLELG